MTPTEIKYPVLTGAQKTRCAACLDAAQRAEGSFLLAQALGASVDGELAAIRGMRNGISAVLDATQTAKDELQFATQE